MCEGLGTSGWGQCRAVVVARGFIMVLAVNRIQQFSRIQEAWRSTYLIFPTLANVRIGAHLLQIDQ